jgi:hypothetical protein
MQASSPGVKEKRLSRTSMTKRECVLGSILPAFVWTRTLEKGYLQS